MKIIKLSKSQKKFLQAVKANREDPTRLERMYSRTFKVFIFLEIAFVLGIALAIALPASCWIVGILAFLYGTIVSLHALLRYRYGIQPLFIEVVDYERLQHLLDGNAS